MELFKWNIEYLEITTKDLNAEFIHGGVKMGMMRS